ncbi:hypothetical protein IE81DRAFT_153483 [Ceraceosorus guamensis]|uniref:BZIP domain-containing protein n=1 Tax=Ceraceosorus guamensis TaxID=1522189 RepID=A0A316W2K6_9BASI|nr:hypothetical protein IE81DRAFT_153483 [Ceraceosorus guamensis]PWN41915.1 hypothetical protein IE81DRAFT_153483 [Ceraceosorus guamensis]
MARGRRPNLDLEPSRQLLTQRAFRERKAAHLRDLEEAVKKLRAENAALRRSSGLAAPEEELIPDAAEGSRSISVGDADAEGEEEIDAQSEEEDVKDPSLLLCMDQTAVASTASTASQCSDCQATAQEQSQIREAMSVLEGHVRNVNAAMISLRNAIASTDERRQAWLSQRADSRPAPSGVSNLKVGSKDGDDAATPMLPPNLDAQRHFGSHANIRPTRSVSASTTNGAGVDHRLSSSMQQPSVWSPSEASTGAHAHNALLSFRRGPPSGFDAIHDSARQVRRRTETWNAARPATSIGSTQSTPHSTIGTSPSSAMAPPCTPASFSVDWNFVPPAESPCATYDAPSHSATHENRPRTMGSSIVREAASRPRVSSVRSDHHDASVYARTPQPCQPMHCSASRSNDEPSDTAASAASLEQASVPPQHFNHQMHPTIYSELAQLPNHQFDPSLGSNANQYSSAQVGNNLQGTSSSNSFAQTGTSAGDDNACCFGVFNCDSDGRILL